MVRVLGVGVLRFLFLVIAGQHLEGAAGHCLGGALELGLAEDAAAVKQGQVLQHVGGGEIIGQVHPGAGHQGQTLGDGLQQALVHRHLQLVKQGFARQIEHLAVQHRLGDGVQGVGHGLGQIDVTLHLEVFQVPQGLGTVSGEVQVSPAPAGCPRTGGGRRR